MLELVHAVQHLVGHVPDDVVRRELLVVHELGQAVVFLGEAGRFVA